MMDKYEPVLMKANEIRGITEAELRSFADRKGYDVLAWVISHFIKYLFTCVAD